MATVPTQATHNEIIFGTGEHVMIPAAWYNTYPIFRQPYIDRMFSRFTKYIYPALTGSSLKCESVDTILELGEIISEVNAYGIVLSPKQILDMSQSSGFLDKMNKVQAFIVKKERCALCCPGAYKRRLGVFAKSWNEYIGLVSQREMNEVYRQLDFEAIYSMLQQKSYNVIPDANVKYNNLIFEFLKWFESCVIRVKDDFFTMLMDFKNTLTNPAILKSVTQIKSVVEDLVQNIPMPQATRDGITTVVQGLENMSQLIGAAPPRIPPPPPPSLAAIGYVTTAGQPVPPPSRV